MPFADLSALSDQFSRLTAEAAPRLVAVHGADGGRISGIIWRTGLVVTAHEALAGEDDLRITLADGSSVVVELAGRDPSTDVALLKAATPEFGDWRQAETPRPGSIAIVVGRGEHSARASFGLVSEVGPAWRSMRGGEIDARITLGLRLTSRAEGGAVVAPDGGLVGLAVTGPRRSALAIPAATVDRAVRTLAEKGYVPRGYLGVSLHPLGRSEGAIIVGIEPESPAARAGLAVGDIITTWNGEGVRSVGEVFHRLGAGAVGETARLGVLRGGVASEFGVTVGERPRS
jgi:S1-C subfamily serine protease